jgi:hypothetical protein
MCQSLDRGSSTLLGSAGALLAAPQPSRKLVEYFAEIVGSNNDGPTTLRGRRTPRAAVSARRVAAMPCAMPVATIVQPACASNRGAPAIVGRRWDKIFPAAPVSAFGDCCPGKQSAHPLASSPASKNPKLSTHRYTPECLHVREPDIKLRKASLWSNPASCRTTR